MKGLTSTCAALKKLGKGLESSAAVNESTLTCFVDSVRSLSLIPSDSDAVLSLATEEDVRNSLGRGERSTGKNRVILSLQNCLDYLDQKEGTSSEMTQSGSAKEVNSTGNSSAHFIMQTPDRRK